MNNHCTACEEARRAERWKNLALSGLQVLFVYAATGLWVWYLSGTMP